MTIPAVMRNQVRQRASFACEYCGVTETDSGGELTIDHFRPQASGGTDDFANLLHCCFRCNLYKADYWPNLPAAPVLWNPREAIRASHLLLLEDGTLHPVTTTGEFTLRRLRLNRPLLVTYRLRQRSFHEDQRLRTRYRDVLLSLEQLQQQQATLLEEQRTLLEEQRAWLRLLRKPGP